MKGATGHLSLTGKLLDMIWMRLLGFGWGGAKHLACSGLQLAYAGILRCLLWHLGRYGSMDDLVELCCAHGELRTLQRTLAAGGPRQTLAPPAALKTLSAIHSARHACARGDAASILQLSQLLRQCCNTEDRAKGSYRPAMCPRGRAALEALCERLQQEDAGSSGSALAALPLDARLQFVQRCHLAMRRHDEAGTSASYPSWKTFPVLCLIYCYAYILLLCM